MVRTSRTSTKSLGFSIELAGICVMSLVPVIGFPPSTERDMEEIVGEAKLDVKPITWTDVGVMANFDRVSVELEHT